MSRTRDVDAASNELGSILLLLSGFPEAIGNPGLLDAIRLDAVEELVAIKEYIFITAGGDLDTTLFFILYPLHHCGAAYQAEILGAASGTEMAGINQMKKIVPLITCDRNDVGSPRSTSLVRNFQVVSMFSVLPACLISSSCTDRNSPLARLTFERLRNFLTVMVHLLPS